MKKDTKMKAKTTKNKLNITGADAKWKKQLPDINALSQKLFDDIIEYLNPGFLENKKKVSANLELSCDDSVQKLNSEFRSIDKPTNVLSFATMDDEEFWDYIEEIDEVELGDIIVALETMQKQAEEQEISFQNHYCHIFTHAILHLLGYDHIDDEDREEMEALEIELLKHFDIANPYEDID